MTQYSGDAKHIYFNEFSIFGFVSEIMNVTSTHHVAAAVDDSQTEISGREEERHTSHTATHFELLDVHFSNAEAFRHV